MNFAEWFAADFAGTLLEAVIQVTMPEKEKGEDDVRKGE